MKNRLKKAAKGPAKLATPVAPIEPEPTLKNEFPMFLMKIGDRRKFCSLGEAGRHYDNRMIPVSIVGDVLLEDFSLRPITDAEGQAISDAADEYSASK